MMSNPKIPLRPEPLIAPELESLSGLNAEAAEARIFEKDILGRLHHAKMVANCLENIQSPFTISLNAPWGAWENVVFKSTRSLFAG